MRSAVKVKVIRSATGNARSRRYTAPIGTVLKDSSEAIVCARAILKQHKTFLRNLNDAIYTFHSPLIEGSVGQHTRHSLDHIQKPLEILATLEKGCNENMVRYDIRERHTPVEKDRHVAIELIAQLETMLCATPQKYLSYPVRAVFMLSTDRSEVQFESTFNRELAFAVHHCIHHNALSKVLLAYHFPNQTIPEDFGMAPSTANFNQEIEDECE